MSDPLVSVQNVTKTFQHEGRSLEVLKGIDLDIGSGEMVTIVGPSGAGKSTLLHLIGTLDLPTEGRILYAGQDVTRLGSSDLAEFRNRSIGFVFQFHHLLPEFTALENVMMPGLIQGRRRFETRAKAAARRGWALRAAHPSAGRALGRRAAACGACQSAAHGAEAGARR